MIGSSSLALLPLLLPPVGEGAVEVATYIEADAFEAGGTYSLVVDVLLDEGMSVSEAGAPALFLQIDVPPSARLAGPYLRSHRELSRNEFVLEPFERLLQENPTEVGFELVGEPAEGEAFGLNVIGYVEPAEGEAFFLRRRLELALEPGAFGEEASASVSTWGEDERLLQLGDEMPGFELPRPDGSAFALDSLLGKKNLIVTTYRAHW